MGLFDKIGKGIKKLGAFTGKVLKGVASGGIVGGIAAGASNLGGGSSAQKATFTSSSTKLGNTAPDPSTGGSSGGGISGFWAGLTTIGKVVVVGGALVVMYIVYRLFKRKRR